MSIVIKVGPKANKKKVTLELNIRKSLSGDLMVFDHGDIDIVLSPANNKVVAFPKETMNDLVYGAQNRLMSFLRKRGLVVAESVQAGAFYGSFEGTLETPANKEISAAKLVLVNISSFIDEERPYFEHVEAIISMADDEKTHPDKEDSTELGEVPHSSEKGSINKGYMRDPYSLNYLYTL
jgi:hypothetical protein